MDVEIAAVVYFGLPQTYMLDHCFVVANISGFIPTIDKVTPEQRNSLCCGPVKRIGQYSADMVVPEHSIRIDVAKNLHR